ncbi:hypothetical protein [Arthrobacter cryoconiti]|uniref:Uncharacterized protein n=1 Tax=Arthrobacter cryoconiti TaxID=748907 RepID=A0ABV8QZQ5_9MICC|nr:hypothetical protein [Arthrobacter cryoconiti]MCC9068232.1 hypothetical protein [Arthrobacter cryoconiti]
MSRVVVPQGDVRMPVWLLITIIVVVWILVVLAIIAFMMGASRGRALERRAESESDPTRAQTPKKH